MTKYCVTIVLFFSCVLHHAYLSADTAFLTVDSTQSVATIEIGGSSDTSSVAGSVAIDLRPPTDPFGTARITEIDGTLVDGFNIQFLGGLVTVSADPGDIVFTMLEAGPAANVDVNGQFSQLGNLAQSSGEIQVFDPLNLVGGTRTVELSELGPGPFDIVDAQLELNGNTLTLSGAFAITFDVADGITASIDASLVAVGDLPTAYAPSSFEVFRGSLLEGDLADITDSDDAVMRLNPGFTLLSTEAPLWLIFDSSLSQDTPASLALKIESNANTPNLECVAELFNFDSNEYEVVGQFIAEFNSDSIVELIASGDPARFVESGSSAVRSRVGWYKVGFTLVFPWQINLDQVVWLATE